jgi:Leucine-rich repeat (LRR) protein
VSISPSHFLTHLTLSGQNITAFTGGIADNLTHLTLSHNELTELTPDTFKTITGLQQLDLSSNQLKGLES